MQYPAKIYKNRLFFSFGACFCVQKFFFAVCSRKSDKNRYLRIIIVHVKTEPIYGRKRYRCNAHDASVL